MQATGSSAATRPYRPEHREATGVALLGQEIESRAGEVADAVLKRWLSKHPADGGASDRQVHADILRTTRLASSTLGRFLVTGEAPSTEERAIMSSSGKAPVRETVSLGDLTKLYFYWRDEACRVLERVAREEAIDAASLEYSKDIARAGCDGSLISVVRKFDAERKRLAAELAHNAVHDALTGLPNRTLLVDRLEQLVKSSPRRGTGAAVLFVDLDRFKEVNDLAGHTVGDDLLVSVARRIEQVIRASDTLARLGGDEFVIVCPELIDPASEAAGIAERINAVLRQPFTLVPEGPDFFVTASVGIGILGPHDTAEGILSRSDAAMYAAKRQGGCRHHVYDESVDQMLKRRPELLNDLHAAIERGELHLCYQPVVALSSGDVTQLEALARWRHPRFGDVPPAEFIPLAEENGMIVTIGRWVLDTAIGDCAAWRREGWLDVGVSINLSARQLMDTSLVQFLSERFEASGLPAAAVTLEITESVVVSENLRTAQVLKALKDTGVRLAIDDFGTGYSSLSYLGRLPIDVLKVDRSFVSGLGEVRDAAIVSAMVDLAHRLKLDVVAEGVETDTELEIVRRAGCDEAQGFLLGRPVPSRLALPSTCRASRADQQLSA